MPIYKGFNRVLNMSNIYKAVVGGTASALGGGKFSNGAVSGAFVHMFNHEFGEALKTKQLMEKSGKKDIFIAHGKGSKGYYVKDSRGFMYPSDTPEMRQHLESLKVGMMIPAGIVATAGGTTPITCLWVVRLQIHGKSLEP